MMEETQNQDEVLTWLATTSNPERFSFIKRALDCCPLSEYKGLMRLVEHSRQRKQRSDKQEKKRKLKEEQLKEKEQKGEKRGGVPVRAEVLHVPSKKPREDSPWWSVYPEDKIFAMDCEMVSLKELVDGKHPVRAATVSIVRVSDLKQVYEATVQHDEGSYIVNDHTRRINEFEEDSLKIGKDFKVVSKEVEEKLKDALVLTVNGEKDFLSLDLVIASFDVFDYHSHWKKWSGQMTKLGEPVMQPIGLRSIYYHYFKEDIQSGKHTAEKDARATAKLFQVYKNIKKSNVTSRTHFPSTDEFADIKTLK